MAEEKKKKQKVPTALKRIAQSKKRHEKNNQFRSKTKTAIKNLQKSLEAKDKKEELTKKLNTIYSLMDKGVKKKIFQKNKADRIKSKLASKV
jgi:small subunit ribosomal protein S20